jgi:hypothetical protein
MALRPRKRRPMLSIADLKRRLSAGIEYATKLVEDDTADHDLRLKGFTAQVQGILAYSKLIELHELQSHMATLEHLATGNGHGPA